MQQPPFSCHICIYIYIYVLLSLQIFSLSEDAETPDGKKKGQKKAKKSNKSKANQRKNSKKSNTPQTGNDLSAKIFATMEKHKEVFFVIRLHSAQSAASLAVSFFIIHLQISLPLKAWCIRLLIFT